MTRPPETLDILLAEDNCDHADLFIFALNRLSRPFTITHKEDGDVCLAHLDGLKTTNTKLPDLIVLDIKMPRLNGKAVLQAIKADPKLAAIHVVMISTSTADSDIQECLALGAIKYHTKPVSTQSLENLFNELSL